MEGEVDPTMLNVAKYVIKKTPIGHIQKALENLNAVVGERVMDTEDVHKEIHKYGETHLSQLPVEIASNKVVISSLVKDDEGFYHDQDQKIKFKIGLESGNIEEAQQDDFQDDLRDEISAQAKKYISESYNGEVTKFNVYKDNAKNKIVLIICAHNLNFKGFWTGEWLSTWELDLGSNHAKGNVRSNTYYYEEGNIQFNLDTSPEGNITGELAKGFLNFIKKSEDAIHQELDAMFNDLNDNYIKRLRRGVLITGTKMNWNVNQVKIGQQA